MLGKTKKEKRLLLTCSTLSPPVDKYMNCAATCVTMIKVRPLM